MNVISIKQYKERKFEQEYQQLVKDIDFMIESMLEYDLDAIEHHLQGEQNGK